MKWRGTDMSLNETSVMTILYKWIKLWTLSHISTLIVLWPHPCLFSPQLGSRHTHNKLNRMLFPLITFLFTGMFYLWAPYFLRFSLQILNLQRTYITTKSSLLPLFSCSHGYESLWFRWHYFLPFQYVYALQLRRRVHSVRHKIIKSEKHQR